MSAISDTRKSWVEDALSSDSKISIETVRSNVVLYRSSSCIRSSISELVNGHFEMRPIFFRVEGASAGFDFANFILRRSRVWSHL